MWGCTLRLVSVSGQPALLVSTGVTSAHWVARRPVGWPPSPGATCYRTPNVSVPRPLNSMFQISSFRNLSLQYNFFDLTGLVPTSGVEITFLPLRRSLSAQSRSTFFKVGVMKTCLAIIWYILRFQKLCFIQNELLSFLYFLQFLHVFIAGFWNQTDGENAS
jgi:hypothetical protein